MCLGESTYRTVFDADPDGLVVFSSETGRIREANQQFCEMVGADTAGLRGTDITTLATSLETRQNIGAEIELAESVDTVKWQLRPDTGPTVPVETRLSTVTIDGEACVLGRVSTVTEHELELSHHLLETVPSGVFRTDPTPDGTFEYVNPALVSLLGADSAEQLRGYRVADFYVHPDEREELVDALDDTDGHVVREIELETLDGRTIDVMVTASMTEDEDGNDHVHKVLQDISDRKARERTLERYERLVENLPVGVYQNAPESDSTFSFVNDAMVEIFDAASKEDLRETSVRELYADPAERDAFSDKLLERGVLTEEELELETLDDERIWGAVTAIIRDVDGRTVFDGVVQNITARKEYERRLKEQRDNLDVLNRMLRHDVRNDLQLVTSYADVLTDHVDDAGCEHLEQVQESAEHMVELTRSARDIAAVTLSTEENIHETNLRHTLEGELDDVRSEDSNAAITVDGVIPDVSVVANDMLNSVFRNLLTNAVQHNDKAIPEVCVSAATRDESAVVRIADNGPGVPDEQKTTIFGKGEKGLESEGTGIGLYLVETLVDMYGGDIWVEDNASEGAVFVVELPLATSD